MLRYAALIAAVLMATSPALAQQDPAADYPNRPVKIIVSVPAGGGVDTVTRIFAARLQQRLGQPFVIENRGGGGGNIGAEAVYTAEPDGYTLLATQPAPITSNLALYKKLNFDPVALEPVAVMSKFPNVLLVRQDFPAKTVQEFIAYAKANPGKVNMASAGNASAGHLCGELFKMMAGVNLVHVPYRGNGPALTDLLGGQVEVSFPSLPSSIEYIKAGRLRGLAVTSAKRSEALPDLPTIGEFIPGYEMSAWFGVGLPKGTPAEVINKINKEINAALADPKMMARFTELGGIAIGGSPADFGSLIADETEKWAKVVRAANIKAE